MADESPTPRNGEVLNWRLAALEGFKQDIAQELRSLRSAVQELHTDVKMQGRNQCPAPGKCIQLDEDIHQLKKWRGTVEIRMAMVMGALAVLGFFGPHLWDLIFG